MTNEYNPKVGLRIYRNAGRASCSGTSREHLGNDERASADLDMVQVIGSNAGVPAAGLGIDVSAMNQYNSKS